MQLGIDTDNKIITVHNTVNLRELLNTLKALGIDKDAWSIQAEPEKIYIPSNTPTPWIEPITQPYISPWFVPYTPYTSPYNVTCTTTK